MTTAASTPLVTVELIAASVWIGSMVCLAVVTGVARRILDGRDQIQFFQGVGRTYAIIGPASLLVAIGAGLWLTWPPGEWPASIVAAAALAGVLIVATAAGMAQARAMTRIRRRAITAPGDSAAAQAIGRGRQLATTLRGFMAATTGAIVVLAAYALSR